MRVGKAFLFAIAAILICAVYIASADEIDALKKEANLRRALIKSPTLENAIKLSDIRYSEAIRFFKKYNQAQSNDALEIALRYAQSAVELDPKNSLKHLLLGQIYASASNVDLALVLAEKNFRKAIKLDANNFTARVALGQVLYQQDYYNSAIAELEAALLQNPELVDGQVVGLLNYAYLFDRQINRGVKFWSKFSLFRPSFAPAYAARAVLLVQAKKFKDAHAEIFKLREFSRDGSAYFNYADDLKTALEMEEALHAQLK